VSAKYSWVQDFIELPGLRINHIQKAIRQMTETDGLHRRPFLGGAAAMLGCWAVSGAMIRVVRASSPVGLRPVVDNTTGLSLLQLPEGFSYRSYGWTGDQMNGGPLTPGAHDGMAVISQQDNVLTLCRNHELGLRKTPSEKNLLAYDPLAAGGATNLKFDTNRGEFLDSWISLSGTIKNCAGGPTPWGTWLSCEESIWQDGDLTKEGESVRLNEQHGYIFEVPASGQANPLPLKAMGRFVHEAVAVDPLTGIVYETEDRTPAGFYRFTPISKGQLADGGRLEMMAIVGDPDLISSADANAKYEVKWVAIDHPEWAHTPGTTNGGGVFMQGKSKGGASFARLEGCWWGNGVCYFVSTSGGRAKSGQVWRFDPVAETLQLTFESSGPEMLDCPDNLTVSPRGGLVICEDGDRVPQKLHALSPEGKLVDLAWNDVQLKGERHAFSGDFRGSEWSGACFSPDGRWLFVNAQSPGITFAITGPWESVGL